MCGILAIVFSTDSRSKLRETVRVMTKRLRHRGPDGSGIKDFDWLEQGKACLSHERLSIVDTLKGKQPMFGSSRNVASICNGEIYNHKELRNIHLKDDATIASNSDCEVIPLLYEKFGTSFVSQLDGVFAFVLVDSNKKAVFAARDPIGVFPLYMGTLPDNAIAFASEMKALDGYCENVKLFEPGHYFIQKAGEEAEYKKYFDPTWASHIPNNKPDYSSMRDALTRAVRKRLMGDVPVGVLISGGLDSSVIAAIAKREITKMQNYKNKNLLSFSVGVEGSPDLAAARIVAQHLGTEHHELVYTIQEGIDALEDVIYHMETYDPIILRGGVALYLLSRFVKSKGIKVLLAGEGADEIFGGYRYFHGVDNAAAFHKQCALKVLELHLFDILRINRCGPAWGVEIRVPFLDLDFLECAMNIDPQYKMCSNDRMEKWVLRSVFSKDNFLPDSILWRQKVGFSDGVGKKWSERLKEYANSVVSNAAFANAKATFPIRTPSTKEGFLYRTIFHKHFKLHGADELAFVWHTTLVKIVLPSVIAIDEDN